MRGKVLILLCGLLIGAAGMFLLLSGPLAAVTAECPGTAGAPCGNGDANSDGYIDLTDACYILQHLFLNGPEIEPLDCESGLPECQAERAACQDQLAACQAQLDGSPPPATGQRVCYDDGHVIACESGEWPGQDGLYQAGCSMEGRFVDNGDGAVTDTCTGLMWQQATASICQVTWQEALQYCDGLQLAGHSDWRLPSVRALQSIADYGRYDLAVYPVFSAESSWYWSSSSVVSNPIHAWFVRFGKGGVSHGAKDLRGFVRAVRGGL